MRRAAISIPSNIAEGYKRKNLGEYVQFLSIADASAAELETQLIISKDLYKHIDFIKALSLLEEVQKMLVSLIRKLNPKNGGQVMIEALIAITITIVGLLGIFSLTSRSLSLNSVAGSQYVAANLAGEGIEIVKNIIDGNRLQKAPTWNQEINNGDYQIDYADIKLETPYNQEKTLLFDPETGLYGYSAGAPAVYRRKINITEISADEIKVTSTVDWTTRDNAEFKIIAEDYFFNWRP